MSYAETIKPHRIVSCAMTNQIYLCSKPQRRLHSAPFWVVLYFAGAMKSPRERKRACD